MINVMCPLGWVLVPSRLFKYRCFYEGVLKMINIYNQLALRKGCYLPQGRWGSPSELKALSARTEFPQRRRNSAPRLQHRSLSLSPSVPPSLSLSFPSFLRSCSISSLQIRLYILKLLPAAVYWETMYQKNYPLFSPLLGLFTFSMSLFRLEYQKQKVNLREIPHYPHF